MKEITLYNQLTNNIEEHFKPPEYSIAARFYVDGFTFSETSKILQKCERLSQIFRIKIENAYQDISNGFMKLENCNLWHNEQIQTLLLNKKYELQNNKR